MRIIAGSLKRRTIDVPRTLDVRPSTDRTREALFNMLQFRVEWEDARVLDLFAGSGALGFEAVSRGAPDVTFVESNTTVFEQLALNAENLGVIDDISLVAADAYRWLGRYVGPPFDLILADPPYDLDTIESLPDQLLSHLAPDGILVIEHDRHVDFDGHTALEETRSYGRTRLSIFQVPEA